MNVVSLETGLKASRINWFFFFFQSHGSDATHTYHAIMKKSIDNKTLPWLTTDTLKLIYSNFMNKFHVDFKLLNRSLLRFCHFLHFVLSMASGLSPIWSLKCKKRTCKICWISMKSSIILNGKSYRQCFPSRFTSKSLQSFTSRFKLWLYYTKCRAALIILNSQAD